MSRKSNIRWRRSDAAKLSHLIRKVNQKILKTEVSRPDIANYQPDYLDYQNIKAMFTTRSEFNYFMNQYKRYLREGAEEVVESTRDAKATKWAVKEFIIEQRAENIRKANRRKALGEKEVTIAGKSTGVKRAAMGTIKENETNPSRKDFYKMTQKEWDMLSSLFERKMYKSYNEEKRRKMLENYIKGLYSAGFSEDFIKMFDRISIDDFITVVDTDETATFSFIYDELELAIKQEAMLSAFSPYFNDKISNNIDFNAIFDSVDNGV